MKTRKLFVFAALVLGISTMAFKVEAQPSQEPAEQPVTYCNPINIDYTYMIVNSHRNISYRSGADPAVV